MASWRESSDFDSLAAALSQAKKLPKTPVKVEFLDKSSARTETEVALKTEEETPPITATKVYSDFLGDLKLPFKESINFKQHKSTVSALEFESSGSRFLSGSHDFTVAYWDFNGMARERPEPFRFIEPMGSYTVTIVSFIITFTLIFL